MNGCQSDKKHITAEKEKGETSSVLACNFVSLYLWVIVSNQSIKEQKNIPKNILSIQTRIATNDCFDRQLIYQIRKQLIN